jgi:TusA-related sulfurtransferase
MKTGCLIGLNYLIKKIFVSRRKRTEPNLAYSFQVQQTMTETRGVPGWEFDDEFDGGEETCGRVIVNLYLYTRDQEPGRRILVISRDPGAPVELPAWCRMTKNELSEKQHPYYLITLKPELTRR